eukprot:363029-Chlamydomonas_euryale.AAC.9
MRRIVRQLRATCVRARFKIGRVQGGTRKERQRACAVLQNSTCVMRVRGRGFGAWAYAADESAPSRLECSLES